MRTLIVAIGAVAGLAAAMNVQAQKVGKLIINPQVGGFSYAPMIGGSIVNRDTIENWTPPTGGNRIESFSDYLPKPLRPSGAIVTGMVPDPSRGWAAALTRDKEEFERALPEYRRYIAEEKWKEASEVLRVNTNMAVSTKVELFQDAEKLSDLPKKIGSFFLMIDGFEIEKYGGYITFLSFTRGRGDAVVEIGKDIGETIHGAIEIVKTEGKYGYEYSYGLKVIMATVIEEEE